AGGSWAGMTLARPKCALALLLTLGAVALAAGGLGQPRPEGSTAGGPAAKPAGVPRLDLGGDPLPQGALARLGTPRFRQAEGIPCFAFCPDGKTVLAGSHDCTVRLWDVATGKELRRFLGHRAAVRGLALSGDGTRMATWGSADWGEPAGRIRLWE